MSTTAATSASALAVASTSIPAKPVPTTATMSMMVKDADAEDEVDDAFLDEEPQPHELAADPALRCRYPSKHCARRRTTKKTGALHSMCAFHRAKANRNQRRLEKRKRFQKDEARLRGHQQQQVSQCSRYKYQYQPHAMASAMYHHPMQSMIMQLPTISSSSSAQYYSSPHDVDADMGVFAHLEPFRTPVPLFKEDLEELSALVDFNVVEVQVSYAAMFAYAHENEGATQSRIV